MHTTNASPRRSIQGALTLRGQEYPFRLHHQIIDLGTAGKVDYYYMNPSDLRGKDPTRKISNSRSCIAYWWAAMREAGVQDELEQQRHLVMATCYALVNRNKSLQDVYLDAFLRPDMIAPDELSVPEETQQRIRAVVDRHDREGVKEELDRALDAYHPSRGDQLGFSHAFGVWADRGAEAFRQSGEEGVIRWLQRVDGWMKAYRKRCPPRVRSFINLFSYQAKCSFYLCYSHFWAKLIPWLETERGLDKLSSRLLQLWHNQNQPIEIPVGQTPGGLVYPTHGGVELMFPDACGGRTPHRITWRTSPIEPQVVPDVFSGQVLALHPLARFLFDDPAMRDILGLFLSTWEFDAVSQGRDTKDCVLYWEVIGAILTAAHVYRQARERQEACRGVHEHSMEVSSPVTRDDSPEPVNVFLQDYLDAHGFQCPCGGRFECQPVEPPDEEQSLRTIPVHCIQCNAATSISVPEDEFRRYLLDDD